MTLKKRLILRLIILMLAIPVYHAHAGSYYLSACRIYGLLKYYSNMPAPVLDSNTLLILPHLATIEDNETFNGLLSQWIHSDPEQLPGASSITSGNIDNIVFGKTQSGTSRAAVSFQWLTEDPNINTANRQRLISILLSFKPHKTSTIKVQQQTLLQHQEITAPLAKLPFTTELAVLSLFKFWNVIEYFFPYKKLMDQSWSECFEKNQTYFTTAATLTEYTNAIRLLSAALSDSHVTVKTASDTGTAKRIPVYATYTEQGLVITQVIDPSFILQGSLLPGDTVLVYNHIPVNILWEQYQGNIANSNTDIARARFGNYLFTEQQRTADTAQLEVVRNGDTVHCLVKAVSMQDWVRQIAPLLKHQAKPSSKIIDQDIGYLYVEGLTYFNFSKHYRKVKHKPYLVLDCRGYGTMALFKLLRRLDNHAHDVSRFYYPDASYPGLFRESKNENYFTRTMIGAGARLLLGSGKIPGQRIPSFNKVYPGQVYVLTDTKVFSFGETMLMAIRKYRPQAIFIGRHTTGANGNVCSVTLPGQITVRYSGVDFQFSDGTQLQRKGIVPDISITEYSQPGTDNDIILEKAIETIRNSQK